MDQVAPPLPRRLVYFGTPAFAVPPLEALVKAGFEIPLVVTQPDRSRGRKQTPVPPPVKISALDMGLSVAQPTNPNEAEFLEVLRQAAPNLIVTAAYGRLLTKRLLSVPSLGCINLHASLLPKYRGAAPVAWAILRGETVTGITIMLMDEGMDTGPILRQRECLIQPDDTTETLTLKLARMGAGILPDTIRDYAGGTLHPIPQEDRHATEAPPLKKADGGIDWRKTAIEIERHLRAMTPWPGAFTRFENHTLKIYRAAPTEEIPSLPPGHGVITHDAWTVNTAKGALTLLEVQMEGKKRMDIVNFLKGFKKRGEMAFAM